MKVLDMIIDDIEFKSPDILVFLNSSGSKFREIQIKVDQIVDGHVSCTQIAKDSLKKFIKGHSSKPGDQSGGLWFLSQNIIDKLLESSVAQATRAAASVAPAPTDSSVEPEKRPSITCYRCGTCEEVRQVQKLRIDMSDKVLCQRCMEELSTGFSCSDCSGDGIPSHQFIIIINGSQKMQHYLCDDCWSRVREWIYDRSLGR